ncbi:hypothetical protein [Treponema sp.]|uniref:hypothetical protein n=1 Tax=Treponema sp. TaxID=166 RepID=UPI001DA20D23|nr:hypothetical protein [Treponema sp.]MBS7241774.1 hypothetical protein [Treponema sp.]MCI6441673.1 hypothetical protein [Spirochaetia bacterium]MDY4132962.1 hypothetical protein [Treponema sp.]
MEFYVNGEKIDITLENEKTVSDVLKSFEEEAAKNDATTIGIKINGESVPAGDFEKVVGQELKNDTKIELNVLSKGNLLDRLATSKARFDELSTKMSDVPVALQSGKDKEANTMIAVLADAIDEFCHTATLCALFPELYNALVIDGKSITEFFEEFAPIVADFEQSLESKDTVTSGDLCEYEIAPRLTSIAASIGAILGK